MSRARVLADFEGRWAVQREILPASGASGRFEGQAEWRVCQSGGLIYAEQGVLTLEGHAPMQAERRYLWKEGLDVYFEDGRFFHTVPAEGGAAAHWCAPDQYDVTYDFTHWPRFEAKWRVRGPRKNYEMISLYSRL